MITEIKVLISVHALCLQNNPKDGVLPILQVKKLRLRGTSLATWHPIHLTSSTHLLEVLLGDEATGIRNIVLEGLRAHDVLEFQEHVEELEDHLHVG